MRGQELRYCVEHEFDTLGDYREALVTYERARDVVSKTAELAPEVSVVSKHVVETILQLGELVGRECTTYRAYPVGVIEHASPSNRRKRRNAMKSQKSTI